MYGETICKRFTAEEAMSETKKAVEKQNAKTLENTKKLDRELFLGYIYDCLRTESAKGASFLRKVVSNTEDYHFFAAHEGDNIWLENILIGEDRYRVNIRQSSPDADGKILSTIEIYWNKKTETN